MKRINIFITAFLSVIYYGCSSELKPTSVIINDTVRHYYPIATDDILKLSYEIENTGKEPLVISEIQTTCGCIATDNQRKVIPEGQKATINFEYDSSKNIGYVEHEILLYGNFENSSIYKLYFDVNVVPGTDYTEDYEILYKERKNNISVKKNYYIDSLTKDR
ncbi:MAG: DUF1573 domain-containing protein [Candidatus Phocaeicola faecipullorum]|nr:DUF1573 domain-containing protein [Candidatus Phocaeicola faecipullorum]